MCFFYNNVLKNHPTKFDENPSTSYQYPTLQYVCPSVITLSVSQSVRKSVSRLVVECIAILHLFVRSLTQIFNFIPYLPNFLSLFDAIRPRPSLYLARMRKKLRMNAQILVFVCLHASWVPLNLNVLFCPLSYSTCVHQIFTSLAKNVYMCKIVAMLYYQPNRSRHF